MNSGWLDSWTPEIIADPLPKQRKRFKIPKTEKEEEKTPIKEQLKKNVTVKTTRRSKRPKNK